MFFPRIIGYVVFSSKYMKYEMTGVNYAEDKKKIDQWETWSYQKHIDDTSDIFSR